MDLPPELIAPAMAPFTGQAEAKIDDKLRLAVPAKYRALADRMLQETPNGDGESSGDGRVAWYCVPWPDGGLLRLYPEPRFSELSRNRVDTLTPDSETMDQEATVFGFAERVEPDKSGRVVLQKWHLELVELTKDVVVVGVNDHLEIRDREAWEASKAERFQKLRDLAARPAG